MHKNNFFIMGLMLHFSFTKSNICWANTFIYKLMTLIQCFQNCAHVSVVDTERIEMVDLRQKWCHRPYPQDCVWRQNPHYFNWCHCKCIEPCALLSLAFKHLIYINQYFLCLFYKSVYPVHVIETGSLIIVLSISLSLLPMLLIFSPSEPKSPINCSHVR